MKIKINSKHKISYATEGSAGFDLPASITAEENAIILKPNEYKVIPTDVTLKIPKGYEVQIRPRSGLAVKHGITVLNAPGTIDSDYRQQIGVILINLGKEEYTILDGDRIAQAVVSRYKKVKLKPVSKMFKSLSSRVGGFGSTGK